MVSPGDAVEANLRHALRMYSLSSRSASVMEMPELTLVNCGFDYATFNTAFLTGPNLDPSTARARLQAAHRYFAQFGIGWSCWFRIDKEGCTAELRRVLDEIPMHPLTELPGMFAERLSPARRRLPKLEVRRVRDAATRADFCHVTSVCFHLPFSMSQDLYGVEQAWTSDMSGYVGYWNGAAIAAVAIVTAADVIGLYSVGTLPEFQGRGYAEGLMRHAVARAQQAAGTGGLVLQASDSGLRLYQRLGFRPVTRFASFVSR